ncbi:macrophage mannose receptor 1-like protein, partial [Aphelenchoides avenae]
MSLYVHLCVLTVAAAYTSASTCPWYTSYYEPDGACYAFFKSLSNWTYAEQQCQRVGGHLASVHDSDANTFMQKYSDAYPLHWLGGRKVDGVWSWTDGSPWDCTNWAR